MREGNVTGREKQDPGGAARWSVQGYTTGVASLCLGCSGREEDGCIPTCSLVLWTETVLEVTNGGEPSTKFIAWLTKNQEEPILDQ